MEYVKRPDNIKCKKLKPYATAKKLIIYFHQFENIQNIVIT